MAASGRAIQRNQGNFNISAAGHNEPESQRGRAQRTRKSARPGTTNQKVRAAGHNEPESQRGQAQRTRKSARLGTTSQKVSRLQPALVTLTEELAVVESVVTKNR